MLREGWIIKDITNAGSISCNVAGHRLAGAVGRGRSGVKYTLSSALLEKPQSGKKKKIYMFNLCEVDLSFLFIALDAGKNFRSRTAHIQFM